MNNKHQLGYMGAMAEEYFSLGSDLSKTSSIPFEEQMSSVFRPPGYYFFINSVLRIRGLIKKEMPSQNIGELAEYIGQARTIIEASQCVLLSFAAVILFLWLLRFICFKDSIILSLVFGLNPYTMILAGLLHYEILHIFFVLLSGYILSISFENKKFQNITLLFAGILWGLCTLIRPTTLILPVFVFLLFLIKFKYILRPVIKATFIFVLGMMLIITPYAVRNYALSKKVVFVNAQGGIAFFAATCKQSKPHPNYFNWWDLWQREAGPLVKKVTGEEDTFHVYIANNLVLEEAFWKQAFDNFRHRPEIYFYNVMQNFKTFNLGINSVFIKIFQAIQDDPLRKFEIIKWLKLGNPQDFYSSSTSIVFEYFIYLLTLFSFLGICAAIRKKNINLLVPVLIYTCFCFAHSLTYMDLMYYYIKIPFLFIFSGYFIHSMSIFLIKIPFLKRKISIAFILYGVIILFGGGLTIAIL